MNVKLKIHQKQMLDAEKKYKTKLKRGCEVVEKKLIVPSSVLNLSQVFLQIWINYNPKRNSYISIINWYYFLFNYFMIWNLKNREKQVGFKTTQSGFGSCLAIDFEFQEFKFRTFEVGIQSMEC